MVAVQTNYVANIAPAVAGQIANMRTYDAITRNCESTTIGFGLAVARGSDAEKGCVQGGTLTLFLGVSIRDITLIQSQNANVDHYEQYNNVGILTAGEIWVQVSAACAPADTVHYDSTTGAFKTSGGIGPILGARWMSVSQNGLCLLHLGNYNQAGT